MTQLHKIFCFEICLEDEKNCLSFTLISVTATYWIRRFVKNFFFRKVLDLMAKTSIIWNSFSKWILDFEILFRVQKFLDQNLKHFQKQLLCIYFYTQNITYRGGSTFFNKQKINVKHFVHWKGRILNFKIIFRTWKVFRMKSGF